MKGCGEGGGAGGGGLESAGGPIICVGAQVMGCAQWANLDGIDGAPTAPARSFNKAANANRALLGKRWKTVVSFYPRAIDLL